MDKETEKGFRCAFLFGPDGPPRELGPSLENMEPHARPGGFLWVHLDYTRQPAKDWINAPEQGVEHEAVLALTGPAGRPMVESFDRGFLAVLRGVNINPGDAPEDMVSLRVWVDGGKVVTASKREVQAVLDLRKSFERGRTPADQGEFLIMLVEGLTGRIGEYVGEIEDAIFQLQGAAYKLGGRPEEPEAHLPQISGVAAHPLSFFERRGLRDRVVQLRSALSKNRRMALGFRRFILNQREALAGLALEDRPWFGERERRVASELAILTGRYVEELDGSLGAAGVIHEELMNLIAERTGHAMYVLTVFAAVFMPLTFVAGLYGMNVAIPASASPDSFWVLSGIFVLMITAEWVLIAVSRRFW